MTKGRSDGAIMQTSAMAILQKAPHGIPSSLQINHIRSTVRPDREKSWHAILGGGRGAC